MFLGEMTMKIVFLQIKKILIQSPPELRYFLAKKACLQYKSLDKNALFS